jgi:AraC-like DNA-binding protein
VGISPSYLSRLFKEEMSMSFVDYINQIRIEKAKYLLINSDIPVKDIGYQTGFYSMQNFFRVFKKLTYITPGNYRQINQK